METKVIRVTAPMAREWLKKNVGNRPFRKSTVSGLVAAFQRGEYVQTHQGIAFDVSGNLLDGQHRLMALAQMPDGFGVEMMVTRGLLPAAFEAIDIGLKRSHSDVLRVSQGLAAVARFMASIVETNKATITPPVLVMERWPDRPIIAPLVDRGLTKSDCKAMIQRAGIKLPDQYLRGYPNANCKACVKGGEGYFRAVREDWPEEFEELCKSEDLVAALHGPSARLLRYRSGPLKDQRFALRDLGPGRIARDEAPPECGVLCEAAEQEYAA